MSQGGLADPTELPKGTKTEFPTLTGMPYFQITQIHSAVFSLIGVYHKTPLRERIDLKDHSSLFSVLKNIAKKFRSFGLTCNMSPNLSEQTTISFLPVNPLSGQC